MHGYLATAPPNSSIYSPHNPRLKRSAVLQIFTVSVVGMHEILLQAEDVQQEIQLNRDANRRLESLSKMPDVLAFSKQVVINTDPAIFLKSIWNHNLPPCTTGLHNQFLTVVQLTLTDFYGRIALHPNQMYNHNHERTFWVESVIPMFKYFSKMTGLISFNW